MPRRSGGASGSQGTRSTGVDHDGHEERPLPLGGAEASEGTHAAVSDAVEQRGAYSDATEGQPPAPRAAHRSRGRRGTHPGSRGAPGSGEASHPQECGVRSRADARRGARRCCGPRARASRGWTISRSPDGVGWGPVVVCVPVGHCATLPPGALQPCHSPAQRAFYSRKSDAGATIPTGMLIRFSLGCAWLRAPEMRGCVPQCSL